MRDKKKDNKQVANSLVMVLQFGINAIVPIILCTVIGTWLTKTFGSKWFAVGGILVGIVAAFNGAYRSVRGYLKNEESPGQKARRLEEEERKEAQSKDD